MDQGSLVLYLHLNWLLAHAIHDDLVATLDPKAVVYSTVTQYLREAKLGTTVSLSSLSQVHPTSTIPAWLS
jgi:hypothetical protein